MRISEYDRGYKLLKRQNEGICDRNHTSYIIRNLWFSNIFGSPRKWSETNCVFPSVYIYCIHYITTHCSMYIRAIIIAHKQILHIYIYICAFERSHYVERSHYLYSKHNHQMHVYVLYIQYTLNNIHTVLISDLASLRMYHGYCVKNIYITSCNNM